jgi:hypothetical protein
MPLKISRAGRQSVKAGLDGESLGMTLLMEVMARLGEIDEQNLYAILDTLVERHGSVENAIVAVKSGLARFETDADEIA